MQHAGGSQRFIGGVVPSLFAVATVAGVDHDQSGGHMWRLVEVRLSGEDAGSTYRCELCDEVLVVPLGEMPPTTV
jgi:hypothetical protein